MWLIARKRPSGWLLAIASQFLWIPYDIWTAQFGFLAITAVSVPVYVQGYRRFRTHGTARHREDDGRPR
jgi:hypothetical protein